MADFERRSWGCDKNIADTDTKMETAMNKALSSLHVHGRCNEIVIDTSTCIYIPPHVYRRWEELAAYTKK